MLRYGVGLHGNVDNDPHAEFTGRNILYQARTLEEVAAADWHRSPTMSRGWLRKSGRALFQVREKRPRRIWITRCWRRGTV